MGLCSGLPASAVTRKVKLMRTILKQETVSGSVCVWDVTIKIKVTDIKVKTQEYYGLEFGRMTTRSA